MTDLLLQLQQSAQRELAAINVYDQHFPKIKEEDRLENDCQLVRDVARIISGHYKPLTRYKRLTHESLMSAASGNNVSAATASIVDLSVGSYNETLLHVAESLRPTAPMPTVTPLTKYAYLLEYLDRSEIPQGHEFEAIVKRIVDEVINDMEDTERFSQNEDSQLLDDLESAAFWDGWEYDGTREFYQQWAGMARSVAREMEYYTLAKTLGPWLRLKARPPTTLPHRSTTERDPLSVHMRGMEERRFLPPSEPSQLPEPVVSEIAGSSAILDNAFARHREWRDQWTAPPGSAGTGASRSYNPVLVELLGPFYAAGDSIGRAAFAAVNYRILVQSRSLQLEAMYGLDEDQMISALEGFRFPQSNIAAIEIPAPYRNDARRAAVVESIFQYELESRGMAQTLLANLRQFGRLRIINAVNFQASEIFRFFNRIRVRLASRQRYFDARGDMRELKEVQGRIEGRIQRSVRNSFVAGVGYITRFLRELLESSMQVATDVINGYTEAEALMNHERTLAATSRQLTTSVSEGRPVVSGKYPLHYALVQITGQAANITAVFGLIAAAKEGSMAFLNSTTRLGGARFVDDILNGTQIAAMLQQNRTMIAETVSSIAAISSISWTGFDMTTILGKALQSNMMGVAPFAAAVWPQIATGVKSVVAKGVALVTRRDTAVSTTTIVPANEGAAPASAAPTKGWTDRWRSWVKRNSEASAFEKVRQATVADEEKLITQLALFNGLAQRALGAKGNEIFASQHALDEVQVVQRLSQSIACPSYMKVLAELVSSIPLHNRLGHLLHNAFAILAAQGNALTVTEGIFSAITVVADLFVDQYQIPFLGNMYACMAHTVRLGLSFATLFGGTVLESWGNSFAVVMGWDNLDTNRLVFLVVALVQFACTCLLLHWQNPKESEEQMKRICRKVPFSSEATFQNFLSLANSDLRAADAILRDFKLENRKVETIALPLDYHDGVTATAVVTAAAVAPTVAATTVTSRPSRAGAVGTGRGENFSRLGIATPGPSFSFVSSTRPDVPRPPPSSATGVFRPSVSSTASTGGSGSSSSDLGESTKKKELAFRNITFGSTRLR